MCRFWINIVFFLLGEKGEIVFKKFLIFLQGLIYNKLSLDLLLFNEQLWHILQDWRLRIILKKHSKQLKLKCHSSIHPTILSSKFFLVKEKLLRLLQ